MAEFVRKFLDISTAHVDQAGIDELDEGHNLSCSKTQFGWWLWVSDEGENDTPKCIRDIFDLATALDCDYVQLDCDAMIHPSLPYYDLDGGCVEVCFGGLSLTSKSKYTHKAEWMFGPPPK